MSTPAEQKLAARQKRLIGKIDEIKSYLNGENVCDQDQLRKTNKLQKELEIRINTFQKDREKVETSAVSNSEEEENICWNLTNCRALLTRLKIRKLTASTMKEIYGRNWRRRKNKK